jgi:enterobactin synthetase component D / holo-[acyl-carrier protein] synthase
MIEGLLPPAVVCVAVRGDDPSASLLPEEAAQLGQAVESRIREFAIGRSCARRALRRLGLPEVPILRGPRREPLWPPGAVGSVTHCSLYCAAAVARQADILTLGIDAEVHDRLPPGVAERVFLEEERRWLADAPTGIHWDRVLFSAKESVYKAWFPLTGKWLGFDDAMVTVAPDEGTFQACLRVAPPAAAGLGSIDFSGRFLVADGLIFTAIALSQAGRQVL